MIEAVCCAELYGAVASVRAGQHYTTVTTVTCTSAHYTMKST